MLGLLMPEDVRRSFAGERGDNPKSAVSSTGSDSRSEAQGSRVLLT